MQYGYETREPINLITLPKRILSTPCGIIILVTLSILLRRPDLVLNPQFWAEDATQWFYQGYFVGGFKPFTNMYGGYLQVIPQAVTSIAINSLPLPLVPLFTNVIALAIAVFTFSFLSNKQFRWMISSDFLRGLLCVTVAIAQPGQEIIGTITNVHWLLAISGTLLALYRAERLPLKFLQYLAVIIICFSAPNALFFLPVVILAVFYRRGDITTQVVFVVSVLSHLAIAKLFGSGATNLPPFSFDTATSAVFDFVRSVILQAFFGYYGAFWLKDRLFLANGLVAFILVIITVGFLFSPRLTRFRAAFLAGFLIWITIQAGSIYLRQSVLLPLPSQQLLSSPNPNYQFYNHGRYLFIPYCLLILAVFKLADVRFDSSLLRGISFLGVGATITAGILGNSSFGPLPDLNWPMYAKRIEAGWSGTVPVNPTSWGWFLQIPKAKESKDLSGIQLTLAEKFCSKSSDTINLRILEVEGQARHAIFEHADNSITRNVKVTQRHLKFFYGLDPRAHEQSDGVEFTVALVARDGTTELLFRDVVEPQNVLSDRSWQKASIDMTRYLGQKVRLRLTTSKINNAAYDWALWVDPRFAD